MDPLHFNTWTEMRTPSDVTAKDVASTSAAASVRSPDSRVTVPLLYKLSRKTHKSPESFAVPVLSIGAEPSVEFPRRDDAITSFSQEFVCAALISSTRSGVRRFLSPETFPDRVAGSCSACRSCILWTKIHVYVRTQTQPPTFIGFSLDLKLSEETDFLLPFLKYTYLRRRLRKQLVNF